MGKCKYCKHEKCEAVMCYACHTGISNDEIAKAKQEAEIKVYNKVIKLIKKSISEDGRATGLVYVYLAYNIIQMKEELKSKSKVRPKPRG